MGFDADYVSQLVEWLRQKGLKFDAGLADAELNGIEETYAIRFPPDLRALLQFALPVSERFPNWRGGWELKPIIEWNDRVSVVTGHSRGPILDRLDWPAEGICLHVASNSFWFAAWGPKPSAVEQALEVARAQIARAPKLIPIFGHRYLPAEPFVSGNPVFSVYQSDVIFYGNDLADYFAREFEMPRPDWAAERPREIPFWGALASG